VLDRSGCRFDRASPAGSCTPAATLRAATGGRPHRAHRLPCAAVPFAALPRPRLSVCSRFSPPKILLSLFATLPKPATPAKRVTRFGLLLPPQSIIPLWALHPRFYRLTSSPLPSSCSFSRFFAAIMADIPPVAEENTSPSQEELQQTAAAGNGAAPENRGTKRRADDADDDDEEKPGRERRKIEIKFIQDKSRRHITFSKRKAGIMKKVRRVPSPSLDRLLPSLPIACRHRPFFSDCGC